MTEKFIGFFRVVAACAAPGCPLCRCLVEDARRDLGALLDERVTDVETRRRLRAAWGLCNRHTWMLRTVGGAATGAAILHADLIRVAAERIGGGRDRPLARPLRRLLRRLRPLRPAACARSSLVGRYRARARCPLCLQAADAEARYLQTVVDFGRDAELMRAYAGSSGLCVPHVMRIIERGGDTAALRPLIERTIEKWRALQANLEAFVRKHDHRSTEPVSESEASACERALAIVAGAPGVFDNDRPTED